MLTGADLRDAWAAPMPCAWPVTEDMKNPEHFPVAIDKACYVGDIVAVVVADSRYAAADAVGAVDVSYEPLDAVVDLEDALSDRVVIHDALGTNKSYTWELIPDAAAVDAAFAGAAHVVKERYIQQRLIPAAMEPRGVAVVPQPHGGEVTVWSATQIPHILKIMLTATTGMPEHKLRVIAPAVGGGFGSKLDVYAEELIALAVARQLSVPVRWTEGRSENAHATIQGRGQIQDIELAADADGKVTAVRVHLLRRHGRVPPAGHARHPAARRVPLPRRLRHPGLLVHVHVGVHQQDAHRRLPRRRPPRGHLRHRAGHGRAGSEGRRRARRDPPAQLHPHRGVPVQQRRRAGVRQRRLRPEPGEGARAGALGRAQGRAGQAPGRAATPWSSASASPPTSRCAGWPRAGCWRRSATAPAAGRPPPCGCCPPAPCRWSPAPRRTARATRPRGRCSWPTSSA